MERKFEVGVRRSRGIHKHCERLAEGSDLWFTVAVEVCNREQAYTTDGEVLTRAKSSIAVVHEDADADVADDQVGKAVIIEIGDLQIADAGVAGVAVEQRQAWALRKRTVAVAKKQCYCKTV